MVVHESIPARRFNSSVSSTITVDSPGENGGKAQPHLLSKPKSVKFHKILTVYRYRESHHPPLNKEELWYNSDDMDHFLEKARKRSIKIASRRPETVKLGAKLYHFCNRHKEKEILATVRKGLYMLYEELGDDIIGLECLLFDSNSAARTRRYNIYDSIEDIQCGSNCQDDTRGIANASIARSSPAQRWARVVAEAQVATHIKTMDS